MCELVDFWRKAATKRLVAQTWASIHEIVC